MITDYENKGFVMNSRNKVTLKNTSSVILNGVRPGETITLEADKDGNPKGHKNLYWRKRLRDAAVDGCVQVVTGKSTKRKEAE